MSEGSHPSNFDFLSTHGPQLVRLGVLAERYFRDDPNTCLIKLRQFGELLGQEVAARVGLFTSPDEPQSDLLRRLKAERAAPPQVLDLFHQLRIAGNRATHAHADDYGLALTTLKVARQLAIWFQRSFGKEPGFSPGPFVPPQEPEDATAPLQAELDRLKDELAATLSAQERSRIQADEALRARESAEDRARREAEERATWEQLAQEAEEAKLALAAQLEALQAASEQATTQQRTATLVRAEKAAESITLDEAATRTIIDQQLRDRGWDSDSEKLRYAQGARPAKGRAMAIAEWPTGAVPPIMRSSLTRSSLPLSKPSAATRMCLPLSIRPSVMRRVSAWKTVSIVLAVPGKPTAPPLCFQPTVAPI